MKRLQCLRCAIAAAASWSRVWHSPAFSDMLASLRRASWHERFLSLLPTAPRHHKSLDPLLNTLAYAA